MSDFAFIDQIFGPNGILATELPNYRRRDGQIQLVEAFARAFTEGRHLVGEGPTGSGKSLAALIPMIWFLKNQAGKGSKGLISTATKGLQGQIMNKDLPFLQAHLPWPFTFAILKGKNNYLCRDALVSVRSDLSRGRIVLKAKEVDELTRVIAPWAETTDTGDMVELPIQAKIWPRISRQSDDCLGTACGHRARCHARLAWDRARAADVIVCNHYLYLLATDQLPAHDIVVFDEAHTLADIAREVLGWTLSYNSLSFAVSQARKSMGDEAADSLSQMREDVFAASRAYMGERSSSKTVTPWYDGDEAVLAALGAVGQRLKVREEKIGAGEDEEVGTNPDVIKRETVRLQQARVRIDGLRFRLEKSFGLNLDLGWVYWKNKGQDRDSVRQDAFEARPVSVAMILRRLLFEHGLHSVGFISATMTVQGEFKYISKELGLPETGGIEVVADSPFNLPQQGAIYIPATLPRPPGKNTERAGIVAYDEALARLGMDLIMLCGGRSLLLFTSWDRMKSVLALIRPKLPPEIRCYVQGEVPLDRLIIKFREDERSVLFGVASLWTGIDVPGNSLIGVLIDKIPFPVPTSPVYSEREELVRRSGGNTFMDLAVPMATLALKQGLGRLIRSETDAGVAIVADTRLLEMGYGKTILASLPRFRRLQNLDQGGTTVALALSSHSTEGGEHGQDDLRGLQPVPARDSGDLSVRPVLGGHDAASLGGWDPDDAGAVREGREEGGRAHGEHDPEEQKPA